MSCEFQSTGGDDEFRIQNFHISLSKHISYFSIYSMREKNVQFIWDMNSHKLPAVSNDICDQDYMKQNDLLTALSGFISFIYIRMCNTSLCLDPGHNEDVRAMLFM